MRSIKEILANEKFQANKKAVKAQRAKLAEIARGATNGNMLN